MVTLARRAARTPLAPVVAVMFGLVAAILAGAVPGWMFDRAVSETSLPSILSFAAPPLGMKARAIAVCFSFIVVGGFLWLFLAQVETMLKKARSSRAPWHDEGYSAKDAGAHHDGRRRPIFAPTELGAPLMSDEAISFIEQPIEPMPESVVDEDHHLEAPLSAAEFDLADLDTVENDDNSIQALIRRLESGLARRATNDRGPDAPATSPRPLPLSADWIVNDNKPNVARYDDGDDTRQFLGRLEKLALR